VDESRITGVGDVPAGPLAAELEVEVSGLLVAHGEVRRLEDQDAGMGCLGEADPLGPPPLALLVHQRRDRHGTRGFGGSGDRRGELALGVDRTAAYQPAPGAAEDERARMPERPGRVNVGAEDRPAPAPGGKEVRPPPIDLLEADPEPGPLQQSAHQTLDLGLPLVRGDRHELLEHPNRVHVQRAYLGPGLLPRILRKPLPQEAGGPEDQHQDQDGEGQDVLHLRGRRDPKAA
jgi:hypothetical protein